MNPISISYAAGTTGAQKAIALDWRIAPFNATWAVIVPGGTTASLVIEHTYDNVNDPSVTPTWIASSAITATTETGLTSPVQFIRANITSVSGGPVILKVLQGTNIN